MNFEELGSRLKTLEQNNETNLSYGIPIYARLDGKGFSKFTKGMKRPFDLEFREMMIAVCEELTKRIQANIAYTQSDEISLYWVNNTISNNDMNFSGRKSKWIGELAGLATAAFMKECHKRFPEKVDMLPRFDARLFQATEEQVVDCFLWRQMDCIKNAISMVSEVHIPKKELHGMSTKKRLARLTELGHDFNSFDEHFRLGVFVSKQLKELPVDKTDIPPEHRKNVPDIALRNVIVRYTTNIARNIELKDGPRNFSVLRNI